MRCNNRQDQINAFAAGELNRFRAWEMRRHLRQCQVCNERLQRAQNLALALSELAEMLPSDRLRDRIHADLQFLGSRAGDETERWHQQRAHRQRKLRYAFVGTLAALTLTSGIVVQVQRLHRSAGFTDLYGRTWRLSGNFVGEAYLRNAQGDKVGMYHSAAGDLFTGPLRVAWPVGPGALIPSDEEEAIVGVLEIDVAEEHFKVQGYGNHALRTANGKLLGYAFLGWPGPPQQPAKRILPKPVPRQPTTVAISANPWGAYAIDKPMGVSWQMLGPGKVQVWEPGQQRPIMTAATAPLTPESKKQLDPDLVVLATRKTPEFIWLVRRHFGYATGYGAHPITDEHGKTIVILNAEPLTEAQSH
jgi:hypothetical protein